MHSHQPRWATNPGGLWRCPPSQVGSGIFSVPPSQVGSGSIGVPPSQVDSGRQRASNHEVHTPPSTIQPHPHPADSHPHTRPPPRPPTNHPNHKHSEITTITTMKMMMVGMGISDKSYVTQTTSDTYTDLTHIIARSPRTPTTTRHPHPTQTHPPIPPRWSRTIIYELTCVYSFLNK